MQDDRWWEGMARGGDKWVRSGKREGKEDEKEGGREERW